MQNRLSLFFRPFAENQNFDGEAQIFSWKHDRLNPGRHVALKIGDAYISLTPKIKKKQDGFYQKSFGVEAYWVANLEEDRLIHGYRLFISRSEEERLRKMSEYEILQEVRSLPASDQARVKDLGKPEVIHLNKVDLASMLAKWQQLKNTPIQYALVSGTDFHRAHVYNCASLILEILRAGGIYNKIPTLQHHAAGALCATMVGIGLHCFSSKSPQMKLAYALCGYLLARGASQSRPQIQCYIDYEKARGLDSWTHLFMIRLFFSLAASLKDVPLILTTAQQVVNMAQEASNADAVQDQSQEMQSRVFSAVAGL